MSDTKKKKQVVMVLAMARSGTSAITRGLKAAGIHLGDNASRQDARNPKGFWEDLDVTHKINRSLLRELHYPWICHGLGKRVRSGTDERLNQYKQFALDLVRKHLRKSDNWCFKDPNNSTLLPFWQSVLEDAGVEDSYVIALRNPLACAYSNVLHSNLPLEAGLLEWLRCLILAIDGTHSKKRLIVSYELMMQDPKLQLERIRRDLQITTELDDAEVRQYSDDFLDNKLRHHDVDENELAAHPALQAVPVCLRVYSLLMKLASDEMSFTDSDFYTEWQQVKDEFDHQYALFIHARDMVKSDQQLKRELRVINKSVPWRLIYPLRLLYALFAKSRLQRIRKQQMEVMYG